MEPGWGVGAGQGPDSASAAADGYWSAGPASAAVAAVSVAVDGLLAVDLAVPGTGELLDVLRGVERECRRLAGVSVAMIGQIEQRGLAAPAGASSTSALVRQVLTIGRDESSRRVRLAAGICGVGGVDRGGGAAAVPAGRGGGRRWRRPGAAGGADLCHDRRFPGPGRPGVAGRGGAVFGGAGPGVGSEDVGAGGAGDRVDGRSGWDAR